MTLLVDLVAFPPTALASVSVMLIGPSVMDDSFPVHARTEPTAVPCRGVTTPGRPAPQESSHDHVGALVAAHVPEAPAGPNGSVASPWRRHPAHTAAVPGGAVRGQLST